MAKVRASRIENIDKNFAPNAQTSGLRWIDAFDARFAIRGLGWLAENRKARNFRRFPDRAIPGLSEAVAFLSHAPSSAFLSFFSNAARIGVRVSNEDPGTMTHMPSSGSGGLELYRRHGMQWAPVATVMPEGKSGHFERLLIEEMPREVCEYRLYLPLYKRLNLLSLGFPAGTVIKPSPAPKGAKPIIFYGTSITQGGCANTAGSDFVSTLGRMLDTEVINLGFSGNGKGEPEVARLISEISAEVFVLDYAGNCTPDRLRDTLPEFVRILATKHPRTPIVLIGNIMFDAALWKNKTRVMLEQRRTVMMEFYLEQKRQGRNIYYIDGDGLLPPGASGVYVDGVHPTSHGFAIMAERLAPLLHAIRLWNPPDKSRSRSK